NLARVLANRGMHHRTYVDARRHCARWARRERHGLGRWPSVRLHFRRGSPDLDALQALARVDGQHEHALRGMLAVDGGDDLLTLDVDQNLLAFVVAAE